MSRCRAKSKKKERGGGDRLFASERWHEASAMPPAIFLGWNEQRPEAWCLNRGWGTAVHRTGTPRGERFTHERAGRDHSNNKKEKREIPECELTKTPESLSPVIKKETRIRRSPPFILKKLTKKSSFLLVFSFIPLGHRARERCSLDSKKEGLSKSSIKKLWVEGGSHVARGSRGKGARTILLRINVRKTVTAGVGGDKGEDRPRRRREKTPADGATMSMRAVKGTDTVALVPRRGSTRSGKNRRPTHKGESFMKILLSAKKRQKRGGKNNHRGRSLSKLVALSMKTRKKWQKGKQKKKTHTTGSSSPGKKTGAHH